MTTATLLLSAPSPDQGMRYRFTGPNLPNSASLARHWVVDLLRSHGHLPLADRAELCTSELVTNAHKYTASPLITVEVAFLAESVFVCVQDDAPDREPQPRPAWADPKAVGGRGLGLVDALADIWKIEYHEASKRVWFVLHTHGTEQKPPLPSPGEAP
ncbi:ATP-binding protein [Streptomyces sp. NPDC046203]|uniref:ATP-binding protein n=1 Tax=Streptomyces sp. NPDC046203 TaxID=3154602 RepID=UPI0033F5B966